MSSISKYENLVNSDGLEFVVDINKGLAYASIRATARMLGVDEKTIRNNVKKGADNYTVINAEILTGGGLQSADLLPADVVFKLAFKYRPDLAMLMGTAGANLYMLGLAGYVVKIEEKVSDWKKVRLKGQPARRMFTDVLQANGASDMDYGYSTNVAYRGLLGMDATEIKKKRNVPKGKPARDGLTEAELIAIQLIEYTTAKMVQPGSGIYKVNEVITSQSSLAKLLIAGVE